MTALKNDIEALFSQLPEEHSNKRYRLVNKAGEYYSMHFGWQKKSDKVYGHIFSKNEAITLKQWLLDNGEQDIEIKFDMIGTLFMTSLKLS